MEEISCLENVFQCWFVLYFSMCFKLASVFSSDVLNINFMKINIKLRTKINSMISYHIPKLTLSSRLYKFKEKSFLLVVSIFPFFSFSFCPNLICAFS